MPAPALSYGLQLLELIAHYYRPVSLEELAKNTGLPKSSLLRYLEVLCREGYVSRDPTTKLYSNTSIIIKRIRGGLKHILQVATSEMVTLSKTTGKTTELIRPNEGGHLWLAKVDGDADMLRVHAEVGFKRGYEEFDSLTRIYLAFSDASYGVKEFRTSFGTPVPQKAVVEQIEKTKQRQFAFDREGNSNGIRRYAVPLINSKESIYILSLAEAAVPQNIVQEEYYEKLLKKSAGSILANSHVKENDN